VINLFKVTKPEYTNKTFRMPNDLVMQLENVAQEKGVSLNQLVVQCCKYALENLED
jgi:predicted HicB family RNase H-like nuclease